MAAALQVPDSFTSAYKDFDSYPRNLLRQTSYAATLRAYATRLKDLSSILFVTDDKHAHVPVRDFAGLGSTSQDPRQTTLIVIGWDKINILGESKLRERLRDQSTWDQTQQALLGPVATTRDPICRFW